MARQDFYVYPSTNSPHSEWAVQWTDPRTGRKIVRQCFRNGDEYTPSKQTKARAVARAREIFDAWTEEHGTGRRLFTGELTLREMLDAAVSDTGKSRMPDGPTAETRALRRSHFDTFLEFIQPLQVNRSGKVESFGKNGLAREVTVDHIDAYVAHRRSLDRKEATIDREVTSLRRAFTFACDRWPELANFRNPVRKKARVQTTDEQRDALGAKAYTDDEVDRILRACREGYTVTVEVTPQHRKLADGRKSYDLDCPVDPKPELADVVEFMCETGARVGEVQGLTKSDVHLDKGIAIVRRGNKKGTPEPLVLSAKATKILDRLCGEGRSTHVFTASDGRPYAKGEIGQQLRRLLESLGIPNRGSTVGFRHYFGLRAAELLPIHQVRALMRHSNLNTTQIYTEASIEELVQARKRMDRGRRRSQKRKA